MRRSWRGLRTEVGFRLQVAGFRKCSGPTSKGPGLSFAGLESSGRAIAYTLESAADRSEGSARVSDENRMEKSRMEHQSDGAFGHGLERLGVNLGDVPC